MEIKSNNETGRKYTQKGSTLPGTWTALLQLQPFTLGFPTLAGCFQGKQQRTTDQCQFYGEQRAKKYTKEPTKVQLHISNVAMEARHISMVAMEARHRDVLREAEDL